MVRKNSKAIDRRKALATQPKARTLKYGRKGVHTSHDFAGFMSALMSDVIDGKVSPQVGNAACNAGGKLLKAVEMQYKYARPGAKPALGARTLALTA
jgi:hypothetical protein